MGGNQLITGVSFRYMHVLAYGDFFNEYLNATDITGNPAGFPIATNLFGVLQVPGAPANQLATPGASYASADYPNSIADTQDQNSVQVGLFLQDLFQITDQLSVLGGLRADVIHENLKDPLPPPGFAPAVASVTAGEAAADLSLTYKPAEWATAYLTADFNQSPVSTNGGGFAAFTGDAININDFHIKNFLYEAGGKLALLDRSLFLSSAMFFQDRAQTDQFNNTSKVRSTGFEAEANFQPERQFLGHRGIRVSGCQADRRRRGPVVHQSVYDAFAPPYGTGDGSAEFRSLPPATIGCRRAEPNFQRILEIPPDLGVGASAGLVATGPMTTSYLGNVMIRSQYQLDGSLFYERTRWSAHLNLYNITNRKNWIGEGGAEGNDLITAAMPFHVSGTVNFRF